MILLPNEAKFYAITKWGKTQENLVFLNSDGLLSGFCHLWWSFHRVFSFATIRGLRVYFATIWGICHWEKKWVDFTLTGPPRGSLNGVPPRDLYVFHFKKTNIKLNFTLMNNIKSRLKTRGLNSRYVCGKLQNETSSWIAVNQFAGHG